MKKPVLTILKLIFQCLQGYENAWFKIKHLKSFVLKPAISKVSFSFSLYQPAPGPPNQK